MRDDLLQKTYISFFNRHKQIEPLWGQDETLNGAVPILAALRDQRYSDLPALGGTALPGRSLRPGIMK